MALKDEVNQFLNDLKVKIETFGILFRDDRGKNQQTLYDLEITPDQRKEIIQKLRAEDYSGGPLQETLHGMRPLWVFGRVVRDREVYIKISLGRFNESAVCISFHLAESPMHYPFKTAKS